ncbi:hypothetical protein Tco_0984229 [Tanacetum coccineum]
MAYLRVIVPVSNLIEALAVVKNGVPRMKGGVGHDVHVGPLIDEGIYMFKVSKTARYFEIPPDVLLICYHFLENHVISRAPGWELGACTASSFSDVLVNLVLFATSFIFSTSITDVFVSVSVGFSALSGVTFVLSLPHSSSFVKEIEFKLFVTGNLASSLINTFSEVLLVCALPCNPIIELQKWYLMLVVEGLDLNGLDRFDEFFYFIATFMVVEGEVLNDFPRFISILIAEFSASGAVNLTLKMKGDMITENLDLKPKINAMMRDFLEQVLEMSPCFGYRFSMMLLEHQDIVAEFCGPSQWKELSKESSSKILPCGDGSY